MNIIGYRDQAEGLMPDTETPVRIKAIVLRPVITVAGGGDAQSARVLELLAEAHEHCYVANTLACPVRVDATVEVV